MEWISFGTGYAAGLLTAIAAFYGFMLLAPNDDAPQ